MLKSKTFRGSVQLYLQAGNISLVVGYSKLVKKTVINNYCPFFPKAEFKQYFTLFN